MVVVISVVLQMLCRFHVVTSVDYKVVIETSVNCQDVPQQLLLDSTGFTFTAAATAVELPPRLMFKQQPWFWACTCCCCTYAS